MGEPMKACGVILAGGQSSRMGTNKALLDFEGEPLIQRLARRMQGWFQQVVVVTNTPELYGFLGLPLVGDRIPGLGPLGGLEAGLSASTFDHAFFCATDMPFVSEALVRYMVGLAPEYDVVVPMLGGEYEPMHAVYSRRCLPWVTERLDARRLRLLSIYDQARLRVVDEDEVRRFGDPERLFFNCNTPEDLERARDWESEER